MMTDDKDDTVETVDNDDTVENDDSDDTVNWDEIDDMAQRVARRLMNGDSG